MELTDLQWVLSILGFVGTILGLALNYFKVIEGLKSRVTALETKMEPFWMFVTKSLPDLIKGSAPGKDELLEKFKLNNGKLSHEEKMKLRNILTDELNAPTSDERGKGSGYRIGLALMVAVLEGDTT